MAVSVSMNDRCRLSAVFALRQSAQPSWLCAVVPLKFGKRARSALEPRSTFVQTMQETLSKKGGPKSDYACHALSSARHFLAPSDFFWSGKCNLRGKCICFLVKSAAYFSLFLTKSLTSFSRTSMTVSQWTVQL